MSDFEARNIARGPFSVTELEEVVAKGHGIVLDAADVPDILKAVKVVADLKEEEAALRQVIASGRRSMAEAVAEEQWLMAEMSAASVRLSRKRLKVVLDILAAGEDA